VNNLTLTPDCIISGVANQLDTQYFTCGKAKVEVHETIESLSRQAASHAASLISSAIARRGNARIVIATGNSQVAFMSELVRQPGIEWDRVDSFHMDEYIGIAASHPSSFRYWVRDRFEIQVKPRRVYYLNGDAPDLDAEMRTYEQLLREDQIDVAFVGFGENGHIAFNDPSGARFDDPVLVKRVTLDEVCRRQQVGEGHFADLDAVPKEAVTTTCSALLRADAWICCVPEIRKAEVVRRSLQLPITTGCPASIVREHPNATVYLDEMSASLLDRGSL
jgi:glucosamine-6-phosphate deaminase